VEVGNGVVALPVEEVHLHKYSDIGREECQVFTTIALTKRVYISSNAEIACQGMSSFGEVLLNGSTYSFKHYIDMLSRFG
jgi:hypothetical protein